MKSSNIEYLPGVDHLRGFAALLIVFYHGVGLVSYELRFGEPFTSQHWLVGKTMFDALVLEGHTAVALFMVLSGFIFTYGAWGRNIRFGSFLRNRFLRIFPLFLLLVLVGMAAYPQQVDLPGFLQTVVGLSNFHKNALRLGSFSSMFWTIGIEWQFYLLFPFLIVFFQRRGARYLLLLMALAAIARWLIYLETGNARFASYWTLIGRIDQFALGMIAARLYVQWGESRALAWSFPGAVFFALVAVGMFNQLGGWPVNAPWRVMWSTIEGLAWAWVVLSYLSLVRGRGGPVSTAAAALGTVSYSIYLWHFAIVSTLIKQKWFVATGSGPIVDAWVTTAVIAVPAVLLVATLSYHTVEAPFLGLRRRYLDTPG